MSPAYITLSEDDIILDTNIEYYKYYLLTTNCLQVGGCVKCFLYA